jgi:hypothetical protein
LLKIEGHRALGQLAGVFREMIEQAAKPTNYVLQMLAWAVIARPGDMSVDQPHNHLPYHFSAVYYPQVPRGMKTPEGDLVFFDPREVYASGRPTHIPPEEGLIVMFPSWLKHTVVPCRGTEGDRISISLNAIVGPPPGSVDYVAPHRVKKRTVGVVVKQEVDPEAPVEFAYPME